MAPSHLPLGHLTAFHVRLVAALAVPSSRISNANRRKVFKHSLEIAVCLADRVATLGGNPRLDLRVQELAKALHPFLTPSPGSPEEQFLNALGGVSCESCSGGDVCTGDRTHDARVVTKAGDCIREIKVLFESIVALALDTYQAAAPALPRPVITLATDRVDHACGEGLLGSVGVAAWHRIDTEGGASASLVGLTIRDHAFEWESMCSLYYQIVHEVFCHGFQGLQPSGSKRPEASQHCTWSEGWIDRLAYLLAGEWRSSKTGPLPVWVRIADGDVERATNGVREKRFEEGPKFLPHHVDSRKFASDAFDRLHRAWASSAGPLRDHRVARFSMKINSTRLPSTVYEDLGLMLGTILYVGDDRLVDDVAGLCSEFLYDPSVDGATLVERLDAMLPAGAV